MHGCSLQLTTLPAALVNMYVVCRSVKNKVSAKNEKRA